MMSSAITQKRLLTSFKNKQNILEIAQMHLLNKELTANVKTSPFCN